MAVRRRPYGRMLKGVSGREEALRKIANRRGALPVAEVVEIASQAAQGLDAAHRLGSVHGDVRPENVFLLQEGTAKLQVKVTDFGMARVRAAASQLLTGLRPGNSGWHCGRGQRGYRLASP